MSDHHQTAGGFGAAAPGQPGGAGGVVDDDDVVFTEEMRDRQARGKDPYESSNDSSAWSSEVSRYPADVRKDKISFAVRQRRRIAVQVLSSPEMLMMAALRDNESIPATRLRYTRMLCAIAEPPRPPAPRKKAPRTSTGGSSRKETR
ncbi:hypothetical protein GGR52DRAFT_524924 [Hypoxylon sp. FL1284]|nr:hypothetical protein GGR52DRAFT_524924 [Hypoxylon sp. FL1284]